MGIHNLTLVLFITLEYEYEYEYEYFFLNLFIYFFLYQYPSSFTPSFPFPHLTGPPFFSHILLDPLLDPAQLLLCLLLQTPQPPAKNLLARAGEGEGCGDGKKCD